MKKIFFSLIASAMLTACGNKEENKLSDMEMNFKYDVEKFYDLQILRYQVPEFESLSLNQKLLIYHLSLAAEEGRDILFDQNCKFNLPIRRILETIYTEKIGAENASEFGALEKYLKRVWFSNGIHHHYSCDKFLPDFSKAFFNGCLEKIGDDRLTGLLANVAGGSLAEKKSVLVNVMFDPSLYSKRVNQADGQDLIATSANHYYDGVTQSEVEKFYDAMRDTTDKSPISYGLNSLLTKDEVGKLVEKVWKSGGMYGKAIDKIVGHLKDALPYAENDKQKKVIELLIEFYNTGDLKKFDEYSIAWVADSTSRVDFVNGFIETYGDPLGLKASWESIVNFKNLEATKRTEVLSDNAQWFEDNSPVDARFKKKECKGVTAKVITTAILAGDCYPATPIGINLPNANWIRETYGSKSVTIENITYAYDQAAKGNGFKEEFVDCDADREMIEKYGYITDNIHTDLHECLGHGSGQLLPGVSQDALKAYGATVEEARADLFGLYYSADPKMVELGLLPTEDAYKAEYYTYLMNGLMTQLVRINLGDQIEEAHMRNRALIAHWVYEKGAADKVVELEKRDGKTYVRINDYKKLRTLFGDLLAEIQRIKSEGDFEAARKLVENYGVNIDPELHKEVKERYAKLNISPYKGFINPTYQLVEKDGKIVDVKVDYKEGYAEQMLRYSKMNNNVE